MNPQVEIVNSITELYNNGCKCRYENEVYTKDQLKMTSCIAFTNATTNAEEVMAYINFGSPDLERGVDVVIEKDMLVFTNRPE